MLALCEANQILIDIMSMNVEYETAESRFAPEVFKEKTRWLFLLMFVRSFVHLFFSEHYFLNNYCRGYWSHVRIAQRWFLNNVLFTFRNWKFMICLCSWFLCTVIFRKILQECLISCMIKYSYSSRISKIAFKLWCSSLNAMNSKQRPDKNIS